MTVGLERRDDLGHSNLLVAALDDSSARLQLASLLGVHAHLTHECPEAGCRRWFVAARKDQTFCSRTCQTRAAVRGYRAAAKRQSATDRGARVRRRHW